VSQGGIIWNTTFLVSSPRYLREGRTLRGKGPWKVTPTRELTLFNSAYPVASFFSGTMFVDSSSCELLLRFFTVGGSIFFLLTVFRLFRLLVEQIRVVLLVDGNSLGKRGRVHLICTLTWHSLTLYNGQQ
jgi:hypothetical protein